MILIGVCKCFYLTFCKHLFDPEFHCPSRFLVVGVPIPSQTVVYSIFQAFHFRKTDFELGVRGEGQDTSRHFEGIFGSIRAICEASEQRLGQKPKSVH